MGPVLEFVVKEIRHVAVLIETSREFGRGLLRGVYRYHKEQAAWSIYFQQQEFGASLPQWLDSWDGDGILARASNARTAKALLRTGLPIIDLCVGTRPFGIPPFGLDNWAVARLAFEHLASQCLTHFAFVGEQAGRQVYDDERQSAFCKISEEYGANCQVFKYGRGQRSAKSWEDEQEQLVQWLLRLDKPVGVMCCHDDRGQQVLDACRRANLGVPDQVAVIGVDNDEFLCNLSIPSLSSVDINTERIGYDASRLLDRLMRGNATFDEPCFFEPAGVIARQSTDVVACDNAMVASAVRYVRQHACRGLSVTELERAIGVSRSSLGKQFKQIVGRTIKDEIIRTQIATAKQRLIDSDSSIKEISEQCGFTESKYFIVVFQKHTGMTPRAFRLTHGRT
jgi:LacI family transcriptional regulator